MNVFAEHGYRDIGLAKCQRCSTSPFWIVLNLMDLEGFQISVIVVVLIGTISNILGLQETAHNLLLPLSDVYSQPRTTGREHCTSNQKIPMLSRIRTGNGPSGQPWQKRSLRRLRSTCLTSVSFAPLGKVVRLTRSPKILSWPRNRSTNP